MNLTCRFPISGNLEISTSSTMYLMIKIKVVNKYESRSGSTENELTFKHVK